MFEFLELLKVKILKAIISPCSVNCTLVIIIVLLMFLYIKWRKSRRRFDELMEKIPHFFKPLPIIGHGHLLLGDPQQIYDQISKITSKPTPNKLLILHQSLVIIKKPEDLQTILNSPKALEKHQLYRFMKPAVGEGLSTGPVDKWKKSRKIITLTFKQNILDGFVKIFYKRADILTDILKNENGSVVDTSKILFQFALEILCETALGVDINCQLYETSYYPEALRRGPKIAWHRMCNIFYQFDFIFNLTAMSREEKKIIRFLDDITKNIIEEKQRSYQQKTKENLEKSEAESVGVGKIFLDLLIELEETGVTITKENLRDEINSLLMAGTDTIADSASYLLQMLALHKEIQEKVYLEVIDILGHDRPINSYDLPNLEYLEKVIKESLRLFVNVPLIARTAIGDIKLGKYIIPKGAGLILAIGPMMRSEEYHKNPLVFNPERFNPEEISKRHPYTFLPFSGGPRSCIGQKYAMMVLKIVAATFVRKYHLETTYRSVEDIKLQAHIVVKPVKGFPLKLTIRK